MNHAEIAKILSFAGLRPQHKFGQNFMIDQNILGAIAEAGEIQATDIVLEVGPGVGNLTRLLAERAAQVLAVDIDQKLLPVAREYHKERGNITWILADVLAGKHEINPEVVAGLRELQGRHPGAALKLVSNLPYNAASPLIAELLVLMWSELVSERVDRLAPFKVLTFTVQYEVAQRMAAAVNTRDYGPLGILIQLLGEVKIIRKIPPGAFWPPPKVHSALVNVVPSVEKMRRVRDAHGLQVLLAGVFGHRRQTLQNALKHHLGDKVPADLAGVLAGLGIPPTARPENLALEQFLELADALRIEGT